ncbi:MAG: hypothetical protein HKN91_08660 [Acidimicrobiia bacterium]|nr:hypothetical protein [Acidimicrobiia bacterium]
MIFRRRDRKDRERNELSAANRIRNIGSINTYEDADPAEVDRRLRNMTYGSTNSGVAAVRG